MKNRKSRSRVRERRVNVGKLNPAIFPILTQSTLRKKVDNRIYGIPYAFAKCCNLSSPPAPWNLLLYTGFLLSSGTAFGPAPALRRHCNCWCNVPFFPLIRFLFLLFGHVGLLFGFCVYLTNSLRFLRI